MTSGEIGFERAGDTEPEEGLRPTALLPIAQLVRISLYWLGLTAIDACVGVFINFRLVFSDIRGGIPLGTATTIVTIGATVVAILVQPTVGSMSDYAVTRWGRRKPFIVVGSLLDVVFLLGIAYSNTLVALTAFVVLLTFSTNIARGPFQGYVPDLVAAPQVGLASGVVGMMQILGNLVGLVLANLAAALGNLPLALVAVAVVELITMLSVVLRVGRGLPPKDRRGRSWPSIARETWGTDILRERSYVWLVASRLFFLMAGGLLFAYSVAYLSFVFGYTEKQAGEVNFAI
ncbi:MAG: MFS transporter, partial [Chloroflexota bacterium]